MKRLDSQNLPMTHDGVGPPHDFCPPPPIPAAPVDRGPSPMTGEEPLPIRFARRIPFVFPLYFELNTPNFPGALRAPECLLFLRFPRL